MLEQLKPIVDINASAVSIAAKLEVKSYGVLTYYFFYLVFQMPNSY